MIPLTLLGVNLPLRAHVTTNRDSNPAWLFSFVDLAFLLLMAMTQLASEPGLDLGEIAVPRIRGDATVEFAADSGDRWQLRVHERPTDESLPFALVLVDASGIAVSDGAERLSEADLADRLAALRETQVQKPLLAPHANSRSQDLLDALAALEQGWPSERRVTVARVLEGS